MSHRLRYLRLVAVLIGAAILIYNLTPRLTAALITNDDENMLPDRIAVFEPGFLAAGNLLFVLVPWFFATRDRRNYLHLGKHLVYLPLLAGVLASGLDWAAIVLTIGSLRPGMGWEDLVVAWQIVPIMTLASSICWVLTAVSAFVITASSSRRDPPSVPDAFV